MNKLAIVLVSCCGVLWSAMSDIASTASPNIYPRAAVICAMKFERLLLSWRRRLLTRWEERFDRLERYLKEAQFS